MDLKEEKILGHFAGEHWYYSSKSRAILQVLGRRKLASVLDVGAGSGVFSRYLLDHGIVERATCLDIGYTDDVIASSGGEQLSFVRSTNARDFDLVMMIDVLEHVDDDVALVRQYTRDQPAGTPVIVTVPAFKLLWSAHDTYLGHKRRYTLNQLRQVLTSAGLVVDDARYFFAFILPLVTGKRLKDRLLAPWMDEGPRSDLRGHSKLVNRSLAALHGLEAKYVLPFNRLAGLTVICLAHVVGRAGAGGKPSSG